MASAQVTFAGASSITIQGPSGQTEPVTLPQWVTSLTEGLYRFTYRGTTREVTQWRLSFVDVTLEDRRALHEFFRDVAKGPQITFTYTHTDGVAYDEARFVDTSLSWRRDNSNTWSVDLTIEVHGEVNAPTE